MFVIRKTFQYHLGDEFKFYEIGDIHGGTVHCAETEVQKKITQIHGEDNSYIIGMGDYSECILISDKRFDIGGLAPWVKPDNILPLQQGYVEDLFAPTADKTICMLTGNHEEAIHQYMQQDITRNICNRLEIPYAGYSCFIELIFDRFKSNESHKVLIHAWHGSGAAQTEGARLNRLVRLVNEVEADVYFMGHLHTITQHSPERLVYRNGLIKSKQLHAVITGGWLKTYTQGDNISYGEKKGYKPTRIGCPVLKIKAHKYGLDIFIEA